MFEEHKKEIIEIINKNNLNDVFTSENLFYNEYKVNLYTYFRVSTENQDFERQILEFYNWAKNRNITIFIENIYCDKYTGKTLKREAYEEIQKRVKTNDYILLAEISRLGRNWDAVKEEWYRLKNENINILVTDLDLLCSTLPNEKSEKMTVDKKFIQEMVFNGVLYASCKKIEEVSRTTKNKLEALKREGKKLGRPCGKNSTREKFIETLKLHINGLSIDKSVAKTGIPRSTFKYQLKEYKKAINLYDNKVVLEMLEKGEL